MQRNYNGIVFWKHSVVTEALFFSSQSTDKGFVLSKQHCFNYYCHGSYRNGMGRFGLDSSESG